MFLLGQECSKHEDSAATFAGVLIFYNGRVFHDDMDWTAK